MKKKNTRYETERGSRKARNERKKTHSPARDPLRVDGAWPLVEFSVSRWWPLRCDWSRSCDSNSRFDTVTTAALLPKWPPLSLGFSLRRSVRVCVFSLTPARLSFNGSQPKPRRRDAPSKSFSSLEMCHLGVVGTARSGLRLVASNFAAPSPHSGPRDGQKKNPPPPVVSFLGLRDGKVRHLRAIPELFCTNQSLADERWEDFMGSGQTGWPGRVKGSPNLDREPRNGVASRDDTNCGIGPVASKRATGRPRYRASFLESNFLSATVGRSRQRRAALFFLELRYRCNSRASLLVVIFTWRTHKFDSPAINNPNECPQVFFQLRLIQFGFNVGEESRYYGRLPWFRQYS